MPQLQREPEVAWPTIATPLCNANRCSFVLMPLLGVGPFLGLVGGGATAIHIVTAIHTANAQEKPPRGTSHFGRTALSKGIFWGGGWHLGNLGFCTVLSPRKMQPPPGPKGHLRLGAWGSVGGVGAPQSAKHGTEKIQRGPGLGLQTTPTWVPGVLAVWGWGCTQCKPWG